MPHLWKLHCAIASCNVCAEPILVITCYLRFCSAFSGNIVCFLAIMKEITIQFAFLSYDSVAQIWKILAIFDKKITLGNYLKGIGIDNNVAGRCGGLLGFD